MSCRANESNLIRCVLCAFDFKLIVKCDIDRFEWKTNKTGFFCLFFFWGDRRIHTYTHIRCAPAIIIIYVSEIGDSFRSKSIISCCRYTKLTRCLSVEHRSMIYRVNCFNSMDCMKCDSHTHTIL